MPSLGQVFEQVAHLLVPDATAEVLDASIAAMRVRIGDLRSEALRRDAVRTIGKLTFVECSLAEVETRLFAAAPGARFVLERLQSELPDPADEVLLDSLPISIYGGG